MVVLCFLSLNSIYQHVKEFKIVIVILLFFGFLLDLTCLFWCEFEFGLFCFKFNSFFFFWFNCDFLGLIWFLSFRNSFCLHYWNLLFLFDFLRHHSIYVSVWDEFIFPIFFFVCVDYWNWGLFFVLKISDPWWWSCCSITKSFESFRNFVNRLFFLFDIFLLWSIFIR